MTTCYDTLIIGGTSGIGFATLQLLKSKKHRVLVASRSANSTSIAADIADNVVSLDISCERAVAALMQSIQFKHLIVSTPMPLDFTGIADLTLDAARLMFEKYWHYFTAAKYAASTQMHLQSISVVSGAIANLHFAGGASLAASHAAINSLVKSLAVELAPVRVNAVSPGPCNTPLYGSVEQRKASLDEMRASVLLKRIAEPCEIAEVLALLVTNANITGTNIVVDGGAVLN
jgi:NAD(P)-dependent dehydrogenase (short-subunit alcohol dehydrogenase family)